MKGSMLRIILTLALFFVLGGISYCAENDVALIINGDVIYKDDFDYSFAKYKHLYTRYLGASIQDATDEAIKKEFIDDLIEKQLFLQEGRRRDISAKVYAGEEEIDQLLINNPVFYTEGRFDKEKYEKFGNENPKDSKIMRSRADEIINAYKLRTLIPQKVINSIKEDITFDNKEVTDEYLKRAEKLKVKYLKIDPLRIANNMFVTEDDIKKYYEDNKEKFQSPAENKMAELNFLAEDNMDKVSVTSAMIKEYYDSHLNDFTSEPKARVQYVLFKYSDYLKDVFDVPVNSRKYYDDNPEKFTDLAEAHIRIIFIKDVLDRKKIASVEAELSQGVPFDEVSRKYSDDMIYGPLGGDMGFIKEGMLKDPLDAIAFLMNNNTISDVIETDKGAYIISVSDKKERTLRPYEDVKNDIESQAMLEQAKPYALADANRFVLEARMSSFEGVSEQKNKNIYVTDLFKPSERVSLIGLNTLFNSLAFSTPVGQVSDVIDGDDGYIVLKTIEIVPGTVSSLEDVSDNIKSRIEDDNSMVFALSSAKHARDLYEQGLPIDTIAIRTSVRINDLYVSATGEATLESGVIQKRDDGYCLTLFVTQEPSKVPDLSEVSNEAASLLATDRANMMAKDLAGKLMAGDWTTLEGVVDPQPFSREDYLIGGIYMKPFIEDAFSMKTGETRLINAMKRYYIVRDQGRSITISGNEGNDAMVKKEVLSEYREKYLNDWLKEQKDKAQIEIKI
jgi:peptidyl-prolyl cis-trans isomerase D